LISLEGRVALITGAARGIGKEIALKLSGAGADIVICDLDEDMIETTINEIKEYGNKAHGIVCDVTSEESVKEMIDEIYRKFEKIDILVNNAGIGSHGKFKELDVKAWDKVVGINLMGAIYMTTYALPSLSETKGSVIFISTLAGKVGMPGHSTYSVSKMGLTALAEAMQVELKKEKIHTGIVYVGFTENEENKQILYPDGSYKNLPARNQKQASREDVALSIAKAIRKRKKSLTLTTVGKLQKFALRFMPFVIKIILKKANNDYDKMYDH